MAAFVLDVVLTSARDALADAEELPSTVEGSLDVSAVGDAVRSCRREAEAAEARKAQAEEKLREEVEARARRARSAQTIEAQRHEAARAKVDEAMAAAQAEEATLATMATAGRIVRERFEGDRSGQVTMRKTAVVFIDDASELDLERLRPYLKEKHLLAALKAWAKATNYSREMPGATIGMRDATVGPLSDRRAHVPGASG
jgi:hypothetical protein